MDPKPKSQKRVRNIGIAAHIDAGKTTLTERILFYAGELYKIGEVHDGTAHMDYQEEEQQHGITITSAVTRAQWRDHLIQVIDTPGHVDFTIEVERSMRVLDGCIIVLDSVRGVEPQTEAVWRQRAKFQLPCLFFINKIDRLGASYEQSLKSIQQRLGVNPVPVTVPVPGESAVVNLVERTLVRFSGEHGEKVDTSACDPKVWEQMAGHRETLLLELASTNEALADQVLAQEDPDPEVVWRVLRERTLDGSVFPCFGGAALRNLGVQPVLDGVVHLLPSPLDRPPSVAFRPDGSEEAVQMEDKGSLVALAFKVQMWEGRRHVFARVYRGTLRPGDTVAFRGPDGQMRQENVARVFDVDAAKKIRMNQAHAGQIVLLAGLRRATTGDTLCAPDHPLFLERITAREPVLSLAIEPRSTDQRDKFLEALDRLQEEDPTLRLGEDPDTGQRLLSGMGELHLQILVERLQREYKVVVQTGKPAVAVRETITEPATAAFLFQPPKSPLAKTPDMKARVKVTVAPKARGAGRQIIMAPAILPAGSNLNDSQGQAVEAAAGYALTNGPLDGAPLEDLEVRIDEVELFGVLSTPDALSAATARAVGRAISNARPALLQPIMRVEVVVGDESLGTVLGDLQSRHAVIQNTSSESGQATIRCEVPLARLLGYMTDLRSMTQGRGQFSAHFQRFDTSE